MRLLWESAAAVSVKNHLLSVTVKGGSFSAIMEAGVRLKARASIPFPTLLFRLILHSHKSIIVLSTPLSFLFAACRPVFSVLPPSLSPLGTQKNPFVAFLKREKEAVGVG